MKNDTTHTNEEKLILLAKADRKNFQPLYEKYFEQIFYFILKRTGEENLTADICQQTFFKAMVGLPKYRFQGFPFSSWLYRIALNEVNYYYRKTKKIRYVEINEEQLNEVVEQIEFDAKEINTKELISKLLQELEPEEVNILEMKYFEEMSFKAIGEILSLKESAAKVRTHRIIKKLRKILSKLGVQS